MLEELNAGDSMQQELDGRKLWLDEGVTYASQFLSQMIKIEDKRNLSASEERFKQLSAAYIYLYEKAKQKGVLDEEDLEYIFENETLH